MDSIFVFTLIDFFLCKARKRLKYDSLTYGVGYDDDKVD